MEHENLKQWIINTCKVCEGCDNIAKSIMQPLESYHETKPGYISLDAVKSNSETALQRVIFSSKKSQLHFLDGKIKEISWCDAEIPPVFGGKSRRQSIDLLGRIENDVIICELKKGKSKEGPCFASLEALKYLYYVACNKSILDEKKVHHLNGQQFLWSQVSLDKIIVAGDDLYWNQWIGNDKYNFKSFKLRIKQQLRIDLLFFSLKVSSGYIQNQQKVFQDKSETMTSNEVTWTELNLEHR